MVLHHKGKEVIAYTAGQYPNFQNNHGAEKYAKFAYSTVFGFSVPRSYCDLNEAAPDSMLAFHVNGMYYVRRVCEEFEITEEGVYARWMPLDKIEVETWIQPTKKGHIRKHRIYSGIACKAYDCGFAYPYKKEETQFICNEKKAIVLDRWGQSIVSSETGKGIIIHCVPNTNLVHPMTKLPGIEYNIPEGWIELITEIEGNMDV